MAWTYGRIEYTLESVRLPRLPPVQFRQSVAQSVAQVHRVGWQEMHQSNPKLVASEYTV